MRSTGQVETNRVTDPYSVALTRNSARSLIVDLTIRRSSPRAGTRWPSRRSPRFEDIVLYELHVRDFSASDPSVPAGLQGDLQGVHPARARTACSTWRRSPTRASPTSTCCRSSTSPRSTRTSRPGSPPRAICRASRPTRTSSRPRSWPSPTSDGFNWGYDPWHYTVPEGSYATDPNGTPAPANSARWCRRSPASACGWSWTWSTTTPAPRARTTARCSTASCPATTTA